MSNIEVPTPRQLITVCLVFVLAFWLVIPPRVPDWLAILVQCARTAMALVVVLTYGWTTLNALKRNKAEPAAAIVIGVMVCAMSDLFSGVMSIAWRFMDKPIEWTGASFWLFGSYTTAMAFTFFVGVPGVEGGRIPRRNLWIVGTSLAMGGLVTGIIIGLQVKAALTPAAVPLLITPLAP